MAKATERKPSAKLLDGSKKGKNIPVEEIPNQLPATIPTPELTALEVAQIEIKKFDVARDWIAEKKEQYQYLNIDGIDDKAGFKAVESAWQEVRCKRISVQKKHTEIKSDYLLISKAIDKEKNQLVELLEEIEIPLKSEIDRIVSEKEEIKLKADREAEEKKNARINILRDYGMGFNGSYYAIGDTISIDVVTLKSMSDAEFDTLSSRVQGEKEKIQLEAQRVKELEEAEKQRIQDQKDENERKQRELEEEKLKFEQEKEQLEKQKQQLLKVRTASRSTSLESLGFIYNYNGKMWEFKTRTTNEVVRIDYTQVENYDSEFWNHFFGSTSNVIQGLNEKQFEADAKQKEIDDAAEQQRQKEAQEKAEKDARFKIRQSRLFSDFGMIANTEGSLVTNFKYDIPNLTIKKGDIYNAEEDVWDSIMESMVSNVAFKKDQERKLQLKQDEQNEANRVAALSDLEKINEYLQKFENCFLNGRDIKLLNSDIEGAFNDFVTEVDFLVNGLKESLTALTETE